MTVKEAEPTWPAASRAVTEIALFPTRSGIPEAVHEVVPLAFPFAPASVPQVTPAIPTSLVAVPLRLIVPLVVLNPLAGTVITTEGGGANAARRLTSSILKVV